MEQDGFWFEAEIDLSQRALKPLTRYSFAPL